jgi:ribose transport system permease protein
MRGFQMNDAGIIKLRRRNTLLAISKFGTIIGMVIMFLAFSVARPGIFPTPLNMVNIINQASLSAIIAGGLTMALIVGEMDLSIAYLASFSGVLVSGLMTDYHLPMGLSIIIVLGVCVALGFFNGLIITKLRVNAVVATLGSGAIFQGLSFAYSRGIPIASGLPPSFQNLAIGRTLGIPNNILIMVIVLAILWIFLNYTEWGVQLRATGGNASAARLSGIRVDRVKILGLCIGSFCAGITGILLASLIGSGTNAAADGYLMPAFAAVFLGSATLKDGDFHIIGTLIGVFFIQIGFNGLAIFGAPTFAQNFFRGGILIVAVGLSTVTRIFANK